MSKSFYDKIFDDATNLKLEIFRRYLREWLPVFMTRKKDGINQTQSVDIYDFFSGKGQDAVGNPGSPLIIVEEIKNYCAKNGDLKANVSVSMLFNDIEAKYITELEKSIESIACDKTCCQIRYSSLPFTEALAHHYSEISSSQNASLVIMDQFGIKEVTPDVVQSLAQCGFTDILFFISSSFIRRFIETPEIGNKYDLKSEELNNKEYNIIHRYICDYYRQKLSGEYYLAPFSIKKGGNIYGIIFGSNHLLGIEKFLKVCWSLDSVTGEANYNIDNDFSWGGQQSIFESENKISKIELFERDLFEYIKNYKPDNIELNTFCLINGFPPPKSSAILKSIQEKRDLSVWDIGKNKPARKGAFFLGWANCKTKIPRARFSIRI